MRPPSPAYASGRQTLTEQMTTVSHALSLEEMRSHIHRSPFHRFLDLSLISLSDERIELELPWRDEFLNEDKDGTMHGGVLASLADVAASYLVFARFGAGGNTISLQVDYLRPTAYEPLRASARKIRFGRTISVVDITIEDRADSLVCVGRSICKSGTSGQGAHA